MAGLVRYPIVLGLWQQQADGVRERIAYLDLPSDLTARDVARIVALLKTLVDEEGQGRDGGAYQGNAEAAEAAGGD